MAFCFGVSGLYQERICTIRHTSGFEEPRAGLWDYFAYGVPRLRPGGRTGMPSAAFGSIKRERDYTFMHGVCRSRVEHALLALDLKGGAHWRRYSRSGSIDDGRCDGFSPRRRAAAGLVSHVPLLSLSVSKSGLWHSRWRGSLERGWLGASTSMTLAPPA